MGLWKLWLSGIAYHESTISMRCCLSNRFNREVPQWCVKSFLQRNRHMTQAQFDSKPKAQTSNILQGTHHFTAISHDPNMTQKEIRYP